MIETTALANKFYESVRQHVKFLDDKTNVRWIALPEISGRSIEIAQSSANSVVLELYADYLKLQQEDSIEDAVGKLGAMCASAFNCVAKAAIEKHGWRLAIVDLFANNLRFHAMEARPSVSDPIGLYKAYVSYNFKFAAGV